MILHLMFALNFVKPHLKKILFLCSEFPPGPGGIGNHGFNLIKTLQQKGYTVSIVTNLENATIEESRDFAEREKLEINYINREGILPVQFRRIFAAFSKVSPYHYILCSGMFSLWMGGLLKLIYRKKKYIAIIHGTEVTDTNAIHQRFTKWALKKFDTVISVSKYTEEQIDPKYDKPKYVIIPNAISVADLQKYIITEPTKWKGSPSLLTVGNVTRRKGQQNMIKALPEIIKKYPEIHYHIVGLPSKKTEFEKLATELNVKDYITFHGKVDTQTLYSSYQSCDVFVMLSEKQPDGDIEGFGIAILEANYFGKPAIGATGCGIEDAIDEGITGYKVPNNNPELIVDALQKIMGNYIHYHTHAKRWALKHDWNDIADSYIKLM